MKTTYSNLKLTIAFLIFFFYLSNQINAEILIKFNYNDVNNQISVEAFDDSGDPIAHNVDAYDGTAIDYFPFGNNVFNAILNGNTSTPFKVDVAEGITRIGSDAF